MKMHSASELRLILERERMRSDRNGHPLSVIDIDFAAGDQAGQELYLVAKLLWSRLRETDVPGILGLQTVRVILPDTPLAGAKTVASDLRCLLSEQEVRPQFTVLSYSVDDRPADSNDDPPEGGEDFRVGDLREWFDEPLPTWKRAVDVLGASFGLLLLGPLMLLLAIAVKLSSPGPIFFSQQRSGLGGRPFWMHKFRSMRRDAEEKKKTLLALNEQDGPAFKIANDPRITRVGHFLRKTSLDELPQLWNVLRGEMSLVGPRPLPCNETRRCEVWQMRRLNVTPGLTCIWQVNGRPRESFDEWVRMDLEYGRQRSLWNDLKLLLLTVPVVITRQGAG